MNKLAEGRDIAHVGAALKGLYGFEDLRVSCPNTGIPLPAQRFRGTVVVPSDTEALVELLDGRLNSVGCSCGATHVFLLPVVGVFEPTGEIICVSAGEPEEAMREVMAGLGPPFDRATFVPNYQGLLERAYKWLEALASPFVNELMLGSLARRTRAERIALRQPSVLIGLRELADGRIPFWARDMDGNPMSSEVMVPVLQELHRDAVVGQLNDLMDEFGNGRFAAEAAQITARAVNDDVLSRLAADAARHLKPLLRNPEPPKDGSTRSEGDTLDPTDVGAAYRAGLLNAAAHMIAERKNPEAQGFAAVVRVLWRTLGAEYAGKLLPDEADAPRLISFEALWDASIPEVKEAKGEPAANALLEDFENMFTRLGMVDRFQAVMAGDFDTIDASATDAQILGLVDRLLERLSREYRWNASPEESEAYGGMAGLMLPRLFINGRTAPAEAFLERFLEEALGSADYIAAYAFGSRAMAACGKAEAFELGARIAQRLMDMFTGEDAGRELERARPALTVDFWTECGNILRYVGEAKFALQAYRIARDFSSLSDAVERDRHNTVLSVNEGLALRDLGRFAEALPLVLGAAEANPDKASYQTSLALLYLMTGRAAEAAAAADVAVAGTDHVSDRMGRIRALVIRSEARRLLERRHEALGDLAEAMRLTPGDARSTRLRIAAAATQVPTARSIAPGLIAESESLLRDELATRSMSTDQLSLQFPGAVWGFGTLLLAEERHAECNEFDREVLTPLLKSAAGDWRLLRLKGLIERRKAGRWTAEGWHWLYTAARALEGMVPTGTDAAFAASWLADKEAFQSELAEAGVVMVDDGQIPAAELTAVYELANGRELAAAFGAQAIARETEESGVNRPLASVAELDVKRALANAAAAIARPVVIFAFLEAGPRVRALKIQPADGVWALLPGPGWEVARVAAAARAFARAVATTNSVAPGAGERGMRPWLSLLEEIGQTLAPHLEPDALVCFLPGRVLTNLPLHLLSLPQGRGELVLSHPVLYAANLSLLLHATTERARAEGAARTRIVVAVAKEKDSRAYRLRLAWETRHLTRAHEGRQRIRRLSGRRATPQAVLRILPEADELFLLCHGARVGERRGYGLYLSDGRVLPPAVAVDEDVNPEMRRFALSWSDFAAVARSPSLIVSLACSSARTLVGPGGVRLGPESAAFAKGTRAIVAPLWNVDQDASLAWADAFEVARSSAGANPVPLWDAHRAACLQMRAERGHFFFWGPFVLSGSLQGGSENAG
jgi:tetratricopeptide (TPR) repeat protein